eukprot:2828564-Amphidinium_carterae.2
MTSTLGGLRRQVPAPSAESRALALQASALLLTKPWLARLPLVDEGASTDEQVGAFTEVCVLAVRWDGPPSGPVTNCVVAVPALAVEGLLETCETFVARIHSDGPTSTTESCEIAVLYYGPEFLHSLAESSPSQAQVVSFSSVGSGGLPIGAEIVDVLDLPEEFQIGTLAKTRLDEDGVSQVIVYDLAGDAENFVTAVSNAEDEPVDPLLALTAPTPRRRVARASSVGRTAEQESVFGGLSGRPAALSAALAPPLPSLPISTSAGARGKAPTSRSKAPGSSPQTRAKAPSLTQVMDAVQAMSQRLSTMEQRISSPGPSPPPLGAAATGVTPGLPAPHHPCAAAGGLPPHPIGQASMLAPGRFRPMAAPPGVPVPGTGAAHAHQIVAALGSPPPPVGGSPACPAEPPRYGRDRQADAHLRAAIEKGGADATTALQLAMLDALARLSAGKAPTGDEVDMSHVAGRRVIRPRQQHSEAGFRCAWRCCDVPPTPTYRAPSHHMECQAGLCYVLCVGLPAHQPPVVRAEIFPGEGPVWQTCGVREIRTSPMPSPLPPPNEPVRVAWSKDLAVPQKCGANGASWRLLESELGPHGGARAPSNRRSASGPFERGRISSKCAVCARHEDDRGSCASRDKQWGRRRIISSPISGPIGAGFISTIIIWDFEETQRCRERGSGPGHIETHMSPQCPLATSLSDALQHLQDFLARMPVSANHDRKNVKSDGRALRCIIMGAYTSQGAGITRKTAHAEQTGLLPLVMAVARFRGRALPFSSACVTQNSQAPPHRDKNNWGVSSIITCGSHKGGELLAEKEGGRKFIPIGDNARVPASAVQCRGTWNYFEAQKWHMVLPFTGCRISIALYCCRNLHRLPLSDLHRLERLGFVLPGGAFDADAVDEPSMTKESYPDPQGAGAGVTGADGGHDQESDTDSLCDDEVSHLLETEFAGVPPQASHGGLLSAGTVLAATTACTLPGASALP